MNGSNSLRESDMQPLYLCPIEIHKLAAFQTKSLRNSSFDVEERYRNLLGFYRSNQGFEVDAGFVQKVLDRFFPSDEQKEAEEKEKERESEEFMAEEDKEKEKEKEIEEEEEKEKARKKKRSDQKGEKEKEKEREEMEEEGRVWSAIRVSVAPKGNAAKKKIVIVASLEELKETAAQKLNLTGKKRKLMAVFSSRGERITSFGKIHEDDTVFVG